MTINFEDINTYFSLFGNEKSIHTVCFMDKASVKPLTGYGIFHGTVAEIINCIQNLEEIHGIENGGSGVTLHSCLNETDLKGRKKANIVRARVICVDIDIQVDREVIKGYVEEYQPQMVVESSPGKYHFYWRLSAGIPLEVWSQLQLGIAGFFEGSDKGLDDITKNIRVPGVERVCKDGSLFMPHIVYLSDSVNEGQSHDLNTLTAVFEGWQHSYECEAKERKVNRKKLAKAIDKGEVALLPEGRNSTLYTAVKDATFKGKVSDEVEAIDLGVSINFDFDTPLDDSECERACISGFNHGIEARKESNKKLIARLEGEEMSSGKSVEHVNGVLNGIVGGVDKESSEDEIESPEDIVRAFDGPPKHDYDYTDQDLKSAPFSHAAILSRIHQRFPDSVLRVEKEIYAFDDVDKLWHLQGKGQLSYLYHYVMECARDTYRDKRFIEAKCLIKGQFNKKKYDEGKEALLSNNTISSTVNRLVQSPKLKNKNLEDFDKDDYILYCKNGVLDLRTLELREPKASDYLFQRTDINWNPNADYSWWEEFVASVFADNENPQDMVRFMQEVFGITITGNIKHTFVYVHYGLSCNGKSKIFNALEAILTVKKYFYWMACDKLTNKKGSAGQEFERIGVSVEGKRCVVLDDLSPNSQWNEGLLKTMTKEKIDARKLWGESGNIVNHAKFHVGCNNAPRSEGNGDGLHRRVVIIPYAKQFKKDDEIGEMIDRNIIKYAEGILRWAVEGNLRLLAKKNNLELPLEVQSQMMEYQNISVKDSNLVKELFRAPTEEEIATKKETDYCFMVIDLLAEVNAELKQRSQEYAPYTTMKLAAELKKAGHHSIHKRVNGRLGRWFRLVRLYGPEMAVLLKD